MKGVKTLSAVLALTLGLGVAYTVSAADVDKLPALKDLLTKKSDAEKYLDQKVPSTTDVAKMEKELRELLDKELAAIKDHNYMASRLNAIADSYCDDVKDFTDAGKVLENIEQYVEAAKNVKKYDAVKKYTYKATTDKYGVTVVETAGEDAKEKTIVEFDKDKTDFYADSKKVEALDKLIAKAGDLTVQDKGTELIKVETEIRNLAKQISDERKLAREVAPYAGIKDEEISGLKTQLAAKVTYYKVSAETKARIIAKYDANAKVVFARKDCPLAWLKSADLEKEVENLPNKTESMVTGTKTEA